MIRDPIKITKEKRFPHRVIIKVDQEYADRIREELTHVIDRGYPYVLCILFEKLLDIEGKGRRCES